MNTFHTSRSIDLEDMRVLMDIWQEMSYNDKQALVDRLMDEGFISESVNDYMDDYTEGESIREKEFFKSLDILRKNYISLTNEETEIVNNIAKNF